MSRDEGGGGWFVLGLGLVGLVGGGVALARSMRPARGARRSDELTEREPVSSAPPATAPASASAATSAPSSAPVPSEPPLPVGPAPGASSPPGASPLASFVRRWTGTPMVPELPASAPRGRLTRSTVERGMVRESPTELLRQARASANEPGITLDELAGARAAASEHGSGTLVELACIVDVIANRAAKEGRSLFDVLTRGEGFGRGGGNKRPASTRLDPEYRHLWAARAVLSGFARGIARDAVAFFDPQAMDRLHASWKAGKGSIVTSCDAMGLLEVWSFDRPRTGNTRCPFDPSKVGKDTHAWVGPIVDVDPWRLLLLKRAAPGPEHFGAYVAARQAIEKGRAFFGGQKGNV